MGWMSYILRCHLTVRYGILVPRMWVQLLPPQQKTNFSMEYIFPPFLDKKERLTSPFPHIICEEINYINEALGSFDKQYDLGKEVTGHIIEMWEGNEANREIVISLDGEDIPFNIEVRKSDDLITHTRAEILPKGHRANNGEITLTGLDLAVVLSQFDAHSLRKEELREKLLPIITHELMHGNIFSKRITNKKDIDIASWYGTIVRILKDESNEKIRTFAYAMYACYYHERQAIISSTYSQLAKMYGKQRLDFMKGKVAHMEKKDAYEFILRAYKKDIMETEAHQTYTYIKDFCNELNDDDFFLIDTVFQKYGLNINTKNEAKKLKLISNEALKDVVRNGSLFFYDTLDRLGIKKDIDKGEKKS